MLMTCQSPLGFVSLALPLAFAAACQAGPEIVAARSLTVQPAGVRKGEVGTEYCNIEGKANGKYASFGVVTFPATAGGARAGRIERLTLTLAQTVPSFAKAGKIRFFLLNEGRLDPDALKFDETTPNGLGGRFEGRILVGTGEFKMIEKGHADTFDLSLDDAARKLLGQRLEDGGEIHLLIVPDDETVAATYFGAGADEAERRPRLTVKLGSP